MFQFIRKKAKSSEVNDDAKSKSKYKNKKVEYDGIKFDSKKECEYYIKYLDMQNKGLIKDLKTQVKFVLLDKFTDGSGIKHREIAYYADFQYYDNSLNRIVVTDVKASFKFKDNVYKLKKKLLLNKYKDILFEEKY
jgi:hypothetical protein